VNKATAEVDQSDHGWPMVQINTGSEGGKIQVFVNDGIVYNADPETHVHIQCTCIDEPFPLVDVIKRIIDPSILEPVRSEIVEKMKEVGLGNGERWMVESEARAENKAHDIINYLKGLS